MSAPETNPLLLKKIVRHYLKYDKDNPFISISALLAFLGIAAGIMVMMIAMGIMNGTQKEFQKKLFVMNYPLTIVSYGRGVSRKTAEMIMKRFPDVKASPFYTTHVIAKYDEGIQGGILYGVDWEKEAEINTVFAKAIDANSSKSKFKILIGDDMAMELGAHKKDKITLYFSQQYAIGLGSAPLQKRFVVEGSFDSGLTAYDKAISYTTLKAFQKIFKKDPDRYDGIHLFCTDPMRKIEKIRKILPENTDVEGWWQQNGNFFSAMQMEKKALFLVLLLIIVVASLNIISSLLMTVMSRRSEIALLRTLGASKREIHRIFFKLGTIIGTAGILAGTALGFVGIWVLKTFDLITLPADVYGTSKLPVDLTLSDFSMIIAGTVLIVLASSIYPARKASSTDPLTVLRNE